MPIQYRAPTTLLEGKEIMVPNQSMNIVHNIF